MTKHCLDCDAEEEEERMNIPHKCPVCDGQGTVLKPPWVAGDKEEWTDMNTAPYECRACKGTGVL